MQDEARLTISLHNEKPVALFDLTNGFLALADEYSRYARYHEPQGVIRDAQLYVREVRNGSIVIDLVALSPLALPFVEHAISVLKFGEFMARICGYLLARTGTKLELKKKDYENIVTLVEPVAKDAASQINCHTVISGDVHQHFHMNSIEANAVQNSARREITALKEPITGVHRNVLLYFYQVRDDTKSAVGDQGIIESVSPFPVKVRFQNEEIKSRVLQADENPFRYAYVIDVAAETIEGNPKIYNVLAVHEAIER